MTASELKANIEANGHKHYFFDKKTMKFFGDTMKNYGVRSAKIDTWSYGTVECWELYRKRPVKHGLQKSAFFDKKTFQRMLKKEE